MALRLFIDEDMQSRRLVALLREADHDVLTVNETGFQGRSDAALLRHAAESDRAFLTRNAADFRALHSAEPNHRGILAVYDEADPSKRMRSVDIVRALGNLEASGVPISGGFHVLNAYRW